MFKRNNIAKKKLWVINNSTQPEEEHYNTEYYEEIFSFNIELTQLYEKVDGIMCADEKIKLLKKIELIKRQIFALESKINQNNI